MTAKTKAQLDALSQKVSLQVAAEEKQGSKLKIALIAVVVAVVIVVFLIFFRKRRRR